MKKILTILFLLVAFVSDAADRISLTVTVTNRAVTSNTFTINGSARTWTNTASSLYLSTNLTSIAATATNLFNGYASYALGSGITHSMTTATNIVFVAPFGASLSGSISGGWGYVTLSTQSGPNTFTALWPIENMVGATNRTNQGSSLVYGLSTYSTNAFATNATALTNHITKGATVGPQYITSELRLSGNVNNGTGRLSLSNAVNYGLAFRSEGTGGNSFQVGSNAQALGALSIAVGNGAVAGSQHAAAIGNSASATNINTTAVGYAAVASTNYATAVGAGATASEYASIALGEGVVTSGREAVGVGTSDTESSAFGTVAVGGSAVASGGKSVALGYQSAASHTNSTAIGYAATTTTTNQVRIGTSSETVSIPGVLAIDGTQTNTTWRGTNVFNGRLDLYPGARTSLANGYNSGTVLGTNVYLRMSGPTAAYTNAGFAAAVDGTWHKLQFDNPGLSYTILNSSGLEATAANRILTGTGALVNSTNNPVFIETIYDGSVSRWRIISIR